MCRLVQASVKKARLQRHHQQMEQNRMAVVLSCMPGVSLSPSSPNRNWIFKAGSSVVPYVHTLTATVLLFLMITQHSQDLVTRN